MENHTVGRSDLTLTEQQEAEATQQQEREMEIQREHDRVQALEKARAAERDDYDYGL